MVDKLDLSGVHTSTTTNNGMNNPSGEGLAAFFDEVQSPYRLVRCC
jgi:hypothetical protein